MKQIQKLRLCCRISWLLLAFHIGLKPSRCVAFSLSTRTEPVFQTQRRVSGITRRPTVFTSYAYPAARRDTTRSGQPQERRYRESHKASSSTRWRRAEQVEERLVRGLEIMQSASQSPSAVHSRARPLVPDFPSVRDCNAALATFGDGGDFLRALRLFVKMRKVSSLAVSMRHLSIMVWTVPAPTLVTYSTLMSRAVQVGKASVALRLWNLMKLQAEFFLSPKRQQESTFVLMPDVKAANILMNVYAKLADVHVDSAQPQGHELPLELAQDLLQQMRHGNGTDVPRLTPNIVTYNTLLDACHKAGELDAALETKKLLENSGIAPDARTYTSLIATVARKASTASGANDPSLAFAFLREMTTQYNIRPNGMTYSALIDVCGRCGRADLALQGLRTMLRQKANEQEQRSRRDRDGNSPTDSSSYSFPNEVGGWTAAIDACAKAGRIETALRLFSSMSTKFGVEPNTITCGCLTDRLLRRGYVAEALEILRYMEREGLSPSEVMYTSLMTSAERLVQMENKRTMRSSNPKEGDEDLLRSSGTRAIDVYTELMRSLLQDANLSQSRPRHSFSSVQELTLTKVFLVFQEMKAVGAEPDLACYNALLRACARATDRNRALEVLVWIRTAGLIPNDTSWREVIRAAGSRSDLAELTWNMARVYRGDEDRIALWRPSVGTVGAMASSYLRHAQSVPNDPELRQELYRKVVRLYSRVHEKNELWGLHWVDVKKFEANPRVMLLVLQAVVALHYDELVPEELERLRRQAQSIVKLDCLQDPSSIKGNRKGFMVLQEARRWLGAAHTKAAKA